MVSLFNLERDHRSADRECGEMSAVDKALAVEAPWPASRSRPDDFRSNAPHVVIGVSLRHVHYF
jgi:hypothetical protein